MLGMSGEELYRRVAQDWPHLVSRFVFLTALPPSAAFQAQAGALSITILIKPVSPERLQQTIADVARSA